MIDYVVVRNSDREPVAIIDDASSIIWQSSYYGVGEFEIYTRVTDNNIKNLVVGNYVTRPDSYECGIIEKIEITNSTSEGLMIAASGRFLKSILDRRIVYTPTKSGTGMNYIWHSSSTKLSGKVEIAVRNLIKDNATESIVAARNIPEISMTDDDITGLTETIVTGDSDNETDAEKQVTYKGLLEYTDSVLQEYQLGSYMYLDEETLKFRYKVFKGVDHSMDNTLGNDPVIFSQDFDNLISSDYIFDEGAYKNMAVIAGQGEGTERKLALVGDWNAGLDRREMFVDGNSMAQDEGVTDETYRKQLETQGRQSLAEVERTETFDGEIDTSNTNFRYGIDYSLGDLVTVFDKALGKYINTRILTVSECQDENGFKREIEYGN